MNIQFRREITKPLLNEGFTFVELLMVLGISIILSTIMFFALNSSREKAKIAEAQLEIRNIEHGIVMLAIDTGFWPGREAAAGSASPQKAHTVQCNASNNEVQNLNDSQAGLTVYHPAYPSWQGPYMKSIPVDPWGNNYFFDTDYTLAGGGEAAVVGSYGPNGEGNNIYDADNIIRILAETTCP